MRDMMRSDWTMIREREFVIRDFENDGRRGKVSLLFMKRVEPAFSVGKDKNRVVIADEGYAWLQAAEEGGNVWMTAMYDREGRFVQIYFDITRGNSFGDPENPTFQDLYLDLVVKGDGEIVELDRDELEEALASGEIDEALYRTATEAAEKLKNVLKENLPEILGRCERLYREMMSEIQECRGIPSVSSDPRDRLRPVRYSSTSEK